MSMMYLTSRASRTTAQYDCQPSEGTGSRSPNFHGRSKGGWGGRIGAMIRFSRHHEQRENMVHNNRKKVRSSYDWACLYSAISIKFCLGGARGLQGLDNLVDQASIGLHNIATVTICSFHSPLEWLGAKDRAGGMAAGSLRCATRAFQQRICGLQNGIGLARLNLCSLGRSGDDGWGNGVSQEMVEEMNAEMEDLFGNASRGSDGDIDNEKHAAYGTCQDEWKTASNSQQSSSSIIENQIKPEYWKFVQRNSEIGRDKANDFGRRYEKKQPAAVLSHTDALGKANMVDVGNKRVTKRIALAKCRVFLGRLAFTMVYENKIRKGDVLGVAKIAGIQAAKKTAELIPLCHSIALKKVDVDHTLDEPTASVELTCTCITVGQTGVEMEALTGVSVAALTIYDMVKALAPEAIISDIRLEQKVGGKTGSWMRKGISMDNIASGGPSANFSKYE